MTSGCGLGSLELFPCTSHSRNGTLLEMQILCESEVLSVGPKPASGLDLRTTGPGKQREGHVRLHHFPGVSRNSVWRKGPADLDPSCGEWATHWRYASGGCAGRLALGRRGDCKWN